MPEAPYTRLIGTLVYLPHGLASFGPTVRLEIWLQCDVMRLLVQA